jgi:alpha-galactosidase/6-phospho-beta-glucosidase family protein
VSNLPHGAIVETFGLIDQTGASAMTFGALPTGVQTVLAHHINQQEMTVQAALTGDRALALQIILNDPLSSRLSIDQARHMLHAMLEANRRYLPQFFGG